jgi:hypothetical protein
MKSCPKLFLIGLVLIALISGGPVLGQSTRDARIELAQITPQGEVLIHLSIPRGHNIESAILVLENAPPLPLTADPVPLEVQTWFLLDASNAMLNTHTRVNSAIQGWVASQNDLYTGLIFFNDAVTRYEPSRDPADLLTYLNGYSALAGTSGCSGDALRALEDRTDLANQTAMRVLMIVGARTRQGNCQTNDLHSTLASPIDLLVIDSTIEDIYRDLADQSGGQIRQANSATIGARLDEINTLWSQPIYALRGQVTGNLVVSPSLLVTLADGSVLTFQAELTLVTDSDPLIAVGITPTSPIIFPDTPTPTLSPSPTLTSTPSFTPTFSPSSTNTPSPTLTHTPTITITSSPSPSMTPSPTASPTPAPAAVADSEAEANWLLIGGAGLLLLAFLLIAGYLIWQRRVPTPPPAVSPFTVSEITAYEATLLEPQADAFDLYGLGESPARAGAIQAGQRPPVEFGAMGGRLNEQPHQLNEAEELLITQMEQEAAFQQVRRASPSSVIGWLRQADSPDYPIIKTLVIIGRDSTCDVVISGDSVVSGQHARLEVTPQQEVLITVLSPHNPVKVAGVFLRQGQSRQLMSRDLIQFSQKTRLIFIQRASNEADFDDGETRL